MKFNPYPALASDSLTASPLETERDWREAPPASCVRVLLSIDVDARILSEIRADWARVAAAKEDAPDLMPAAVATALGRLQRHMVNVAGAAVIEPRGNPFAAWMPRQAA